MRIDLQALRKRFWRRDAIPAWAVLLYTVVRGVVGVASDVDFVARDVPWADIGGVLNSFIFDAWFTLILALGGLAWLGVVGSRPAPSLTGELKTEKIPAPHPSVDVYESRADLNRARGGLEEELRQVDEAWAAWPVGTHAQAHDVFARTGKPQKLILLDPWHTHIKTIASLFQRTTEELQSDILITTRLARKAGAQVFWFNGPMTSMLFGNPMSDDGWLRIEIAFPLSSTRPSVLLRRSSSARLYDDLRAVFEAMIGDEATELATNRIAHQVDFHRMYFQLLHHEANPPAGMGKTPDEVEGERTSAEHRTETLLRSACGNEEAERFLAAGRGYRKTLQEKVDDQRDCLATIVSELQGRN